MLLSEGGPPPSQEPPNCCTTGLKPVWNQIDGSYISRSPPSESNMEQLSDVLIKSGSWKITFEMDPFNLNSDAPLQHFQSQIFLVWAHCDGTSKTFHVS